MNDMKRIVTLFFLLLRAFLAGAQNNPYGINDECYQYMNQADALIGKPGFAEANANLLHSAVKHEDKKAQVLYYVENLRDAARRPDAEEKEVLEAHESLTQIARKLDYVQYYYQSYQTLKNFYFNRGKMIRALEVIDEMQKTAVREGDEYGIWFAHKEFASVYMNYSAFHVAREHLSALIKVWQTTEDPTIRRQNLAPFYIDYSKTFAPEIDSARFYLDKAWEVVSVPVDSVRCMQESAVLAVVNRDEKTYRHYRDLVLNTPHRQGIGRGIPEMFGVIDSILDGTIGQPSVRDLYKFSMPQMRIISLVAEDKGFHALAENLKDQCILSMETDLSDLLKMNMSEMAARLGNDELSADLARKNRQMTNLLRASGIIGLLLVALLVYVSLKLRREKTGKK